MPCPFTGPKMFCAVPNFLCQSKNLFCARQKDGLHSVKLCWHKNFEEELNAVKFLVWLKKFGLTQNILGPVKGQGIENHLK